MDGIWKHRLSILVWTKNIFEKEKFSKPMTWFSAREFFKHKSKILEQFFSNNIIVDGDFNFPLSKTDKKGGRGVKSRKNVASEVEQVMCF